MDKAAAYCCLGTPLESAESDLLSRKQPRGTRAPRVWEQIVTDDRGRRRLHGAFTGGFSAGYFNSVDTKEGFVPRSFRTSRSQRAEERPQAVRDFYDKDELEDLDRLNIETHDAYDTFATLKTERARERTEKEARSHPIIPGDVVDEFVESVSESIGDDRNGMMFGDCVVGVKLLQKMGWRQGKGIGEAFQLDVQKTGWGPDASISRDRTHVWQQDPKMNVHGLGFDPFRGSGAFRKHGMHLRPSQASTKRSRGIAFGVGVLEETDTFGEIGDYVDSHNHDHMNYYDESDRSEDDRQPPPRHRDQKRIAHRSSDKESLVAGFKKGSILHQKHIFRLPVVPADFVPRHQRSESTSKDPKASHLSVPAPQIPVDSELKRSIDRVAVFVAKGGTMSEELVRQQHDGDERFGFLFGGDGSEYYRWKILDIKVTFQKLGVDCIGLREAPLTADERGFLLGDERMKESRTRSQAVSHPFIHGVPEADRARVQSALQSTFVKSSDAVLHSEQTRGGLRAPKPKEEAPKEDVVFEKPVSELTPVRFFMDWYPVSLLYKRFNLADPLKGVPREEEQKSRFMNYESALDVVKDEAPEEKDPSTAPAEDEVDITLPPPEYTEPPLDIFKSIFDPSDDEETRADEMEKEARGKDADDGLAKIPSSCRDETGSPASSHEIPAVGPNPIERKRLIVSSDESEEEERKKEESKRTSKRRKKKSKSPEPFDESVLSGLSASEFETLLKTLKKGRAKKRAKQEAKRKKRKEKKRGKASHTIAD